MPIRKQTLYDAHQDKYARFVSNVDIPTNNPETIATEAVVFQLVGARSHWKCPIEYFLADQMSSKSQAQFVRMALEKAAKAWLRIWFITTDGTAVSTSMFRELGCNFTTSFETMITKFKYPTEDYYVFAILYPCHMLKFVKSALGFNY